MEGNSVQIILLYRPIPCVQLGALHCLQGQARSQGEGFGLSNHSQLSTTPTITVFKR